MTCIVTVVNECGYSEAIQGLSYNKEQPIDKMYRVLEKLAPLDKGHNKVLRMIQVWLEMTAPRFFWQEFDTYKIGTTASSQSTMHSIHKRLLSEDDFDNKIITHETLELLNSFIKDLQEEENVQFRNSLLLKIKQVLPEAYLQKRMVNLNYATLRNIILQRKTHRLPHWQEFIFQIKNQLEHSELLP